MNSQSATFVEPVLVEDRERDEGDDVDQHIFPQQFINARLPPDVHTRVQLC